MSYQAFSEKQKTVLSWWVPGNPHFGREAIVCDGAVRSGKTLAMGLSFFLWAMACFDGKRFGVCGKTISSLYPATRALGAGYVDKIFYLTAKASTRREAFRAAADGALDFLAEPQMRYRIYGGNQTGVMTGVTTKEDYRRRRIDLFEARVRSFAQTVNLPELDQALLWSQARVACFEHNRGGWRALWKLRKINTVTSLFELTVLRLPTPLFRIAIRLVQKGIL